MNTFWMEFSHLTALTHSSPAAEMSVQIDWIGMRPTVVSVELNSWWIVPVQNCTTLRPALCGAPALAERTGASLFGRGMLTGNIMHSHYNKPMSLILLGFLCLTYSTCLYTVREENTHKSTVRWHKHVVTQTCTLNHRPLTVWCRTAWSLVSSPRRPALSGRLAETDWHLAFRTPQSFQAAHTAFFQWKERQRERLVT